MRWQQEILCSEGSEAPLLGAPRAEGRTWARQPLRSPPTSSALPPSAITIRHPDAIEDVGHSKDPQAAKPHRRGGLSCWVCRSSNCLAFPLQKSFGTPQTAAP